MLCIAASFNLELDKYEQMTKLDRHERMVSSRPLMLNSQLACRRRILLGNYKQTASSRSNVLNSWLA